MMAVGALRTMRERGIAVPDDIALIGMDNSEAATMTWPQLSSVDLGSAERGRRAAELLIERLSGDRNARPRQILVRPNLVVRGSTAGVAG